MVLTIVLATYNAVPFVFVAAIVTSAIRAITL